MPTKERRTEKRPSWTMDVMILANMNEIGKYIDNSALKTEAGELTSMITWKAGLKQFYRNIQSFLKEEICDQIDASFLVLDDIIDIVEARPPTKNNEIKRALELLGLITDVMYQARNDLFMKFIEIEDNWKKTLDYSMGALDPNLRDKETGRMMKKDGKNKKPK